MNIELSFGMYYAKGFLHVKRGRQSHCMLRKRAHSEMRVLKRELIDQVAGSYKGGVTLFLNNEWYDYHR